VDMSQLIVAPTIAYKFNATSSVGISPLLVEQIFKVDGLQAYGGFSSNAAALTNNGYDTSNGIGVRLGYFGKINDMLSVGASYAPKISMSKFSKYAGLFADGGNFDIPENYAVGISAKMSPDVVIAADYQRINYAAVPSVGNPSNNAAPFGSPNGPGFGWSNIDIWKVGAQWQYSHELALRAGIAVSGNPIQSRDASLNILAPGVITTQYTLGATYSLSDSTDLTVAYMNAPSNSVNGLNQSGGTDTIHMSQQSLGMQIEWKF